MSSVKNGVVYDKNGVQIICNDSLVAMRSMEDNSVDSVVKTEGVQSLRSGIVTATSSKRQSLRSGIVTATPVRRDNAKRAKPA